MGKIYWLNKEETEIENGPHGWPNTLNRHGVFKSSGPEGVGEEHIRMAHGRPAPDAPVYDPATHYLEAVQLDAPEGELVIPVIAYTVKELAQIEADRVTAAVSQIWQAAHDYEFRHISGSAIGLLVVGVTQALPMSTSVQGWIATLWDLYYQHKADIESGTAFDQAMLDFSNVGPMPHTVPELRTEIGF